MSETYFTELKRAMEFLAQDPKTVFVGYNAKNSGKANGTLKDVPYNQIIETPVAENLIVGLAIGMSLEGYKPIVYIERFDFVLNALDAIVNHLMKYKDISEGHFVPKVVIRTVVGKKRAPLFSGCTHTQDFTEAMRKLISFPVVRLNRRDQVYEEYVRAYLSTESTMIIEEFDLYPTT